MARKEETSSSRKGLPERDVPMPGQPPSTHRERPEDPHEIPLETDEAQGRAGDTHPLSGRTGSVAGQRGHKVPGQTRGAAGLSDRENRDEQPRRRRGREA